MRDIEIVRLLKFVKFTFIVLASIFVATAKASSGQLEKQQPFTINDYFDVNRVVELAISSDGQLAAFAIEYQSLEENRNKRRVYIISTAPGSAPIFMGQLESAQKLAWIPQKQALAFLMNVDGLSQVCSYDFLTKETQQHTKADTSVAQFRFAPTGAMLAYLTQNKPDLDPESFYNSTYDSNYERLHNGQEGVVIDSDNVSVYDFVDSNWPDLSLRPENRLWLTGEKKSARAVEVPGRVKNFIWSSDGKMLSVIYVADNIPAHAFFDNYTSLGLFDVKSSRFMGYASAEFSLDTRTTKTYYKGGEWIPGKNKLYARRVIERNSWFRRGEWALLDATEDDVSKVNWREIEYSSADRFIPIKGMGLHIEKAVRAVRALYQLTDGGLRRADILKDVAGSAYKFSFSESHEAAVFVNESMTRPQEIFFWQKNKGARQITRINERVASKALPDVSELRWTSKDGVEVHGWLLSPLERGRLKEGWPMVTFVHGGPGLPVRNEFGFYFLKGYWPYPFEVYALNGLAVFIPNYRGTMTYGEEFGDPKKIDGEPIDDIVSGIKHLIEKGIADPERLAISGHSHGGWLAPLVMTRARMFRAGSFSEGAGNSIVNYNLMPGLLNKRTHDVIFGGSPYEYPERHIELSPEMHFSGLDSAVLFEAGVKFSGINMLGYPKAARNAGMPTEYIVYPRSGHNITLPLLKKESAERNLDWFLFWLKGERDPEPDKAGQYIRWDQKREQRDAAYREPDRCPPQQQLNETKCRQ